MSCITNVFIKRINVDERSFFLVPVLNLFVNYNLKYKQNKQIK